MAEGGRNPDYTEDDFLYCSVCMEEYEDPRALPCLHTFCYKCLVQLSMKGDVSEAPEKQLASYIGTLLNILDKQSTLKCPICSEDHPISKDKGVAGFRKDFRISQLIQQQRSKNNVEVQKSNETPDTDAEKCPDHPDEKLLYHCENPGCKSDICQMCWADKHNKHSVILLSKKIKDSKDALCKEVLKIITEISSEINILSKTEKSVIEQYTAVETDLKQRFADIQEKLKGTFDNSSTELESQRNLQEKKIADKLENLRTLHASFEAIQDDLEQNTRAQTNTTVNEYQLLSGHMKRLNIDLSQWNFLYTAVQLPTCNFNNLIKRAALVEYHDAYLGKAPDPKEEGRKEKVSAKGEKAVPAGKDPKQVVKETQENQPGPTCTPSKKEDSSQKGKLSKTYKLKLETSFRAVDDVESLAASKIDMLYVATKDHLSHYKTNPVENVFVKDLVANTNAIATAVSKSDKVHFLVQLNAKGRTLTFSCLERDSAFVHSLEKECLEHLASSDNLISYAYNENSKLHVRCLSIENGSPKISSLGSTAQIPFESGSMSSMCVH